MKPSLLLIGIGNPGASYGDTRHNVGFQGMDVLSAAYGQGEWKEVSKFNALLQEGRIVTVPVLLVKPLLYVNRSGEVIRKIVDFYKMNVAEQVLVVTDDLDIPLGELRLRKNGGPGTHNGMRSIVEQFGEGFPRLRIGIGPKDAVQDLSTWVLSSFTPEERKTINTTLEKLPETVQSFVLGNP
jgi:peptidyl-tRNA hydrolase, PTH1 family